jgi:hypothetical protein
MDQFCNKFKVLAISKKRNEHKDISDVTRDTIFYDSNCNVINGSEPLSKRKKTCPLDEHLSKRMKT